MPQGAFNDVPQAVDASGAEAALKSVERQFAGELDAPVLDEVERLAFLAETVGFETVDHRGREAVERDPFVVDGAELGDYRTVLSVPMLNIGAIYINRQEVRPFTDKEIAVESFAAQAVIAIENARLITETREALEQQNATAELLQVINSSLGDLVPVFDTMLDKGLHLCEAAFGTLWSISMQLRCGVCRPASPRS